MISNENYMFIIVFQYCIAIVKDNNFDINTIWLVVLGKLHHGMDWLIDV